MQGKWCDDYDSAEFRRLWHSCLTLREIADRYGVHLTTVRIAALRRGLPPKSTVNAGLRK